MNTAKLRYGLLLATVIVLCAISLPLIAAHKGHEDNDEVVVAFKDLPAPVAATLTNAAGPGAIDKIEMENEDGVTQYSADITRDGKKYEVKIAADGRLIKTEVDDEEDNDRNDEHEDTD